MKKFVEDCLEFLFRTVGGVFVLCVLMLLVFMAIFWPKPEREPVAWLGVVGTDVNAQVVQQSRLPFSRGVRVDQVFPNSPADYANVAPGDFIVQFGKQLVMSQSHLRTLLFQTEPEGSVPLTIYRDGAYYNLLLRLAIRSMENGLPANAAAFTPTGQPSVASAPPITPDATEVHAFRGVCSNCHIIMSKLAVNQSSAQLVAALRQQQNTPAPQMSMPQTNMQQAAPAPQAATVDVIPPPPTEEFAWAGIDVQPLGPGVSRVLGLPANSTGVVADEVLPGSRGARGGLKNGDLIREINGIAVTDVNTFAKILRAQKLTGGVLLVQRVGETLYVTVPEI